MTKKFISILIITILISPLFSVLSSWPVKASPGWWNPSWTCRKPITITELSGSGLTDYQVEIVVSYEPTMQVDFGDVRFIDSDDANPLSHWRESYVSSVSAVFWVKVPSIPASGTVTIYMYYGNPAVSTASNGAATFIFFDDFNRGNQADITIEDTYSKTGGGTWSIEDNKLKNIGAAGDPNKLLFYSLGTVGYPVVMKTKINVTTFGGGDLARMGLSCCMESNGQGYCSLLHQDQNSLDLLNDLRSWGTKFTQSWSLDTPYYLEFLVIDPSTRNGKTRLWEVGDSVPLWSDGNFGGGAARTWGYLGFGGSRRADVTYFDDVYVRKYVDPEPSYSMGAEEVVTPPAVTTNDATNITTTATRLNGNLDSLGTADNATVSFEWGLTTSYGTETTPQTANSTGAFYFDLGSLLPGTTYHFCAKAVAHGTSYGADRSFTTGTTPPTITTNDAINITATGARLNGNLDSLGTASNVTASFQWGTGSGVYPNETAPQSMNTTGAFSFDLSGLSEGTTYYFRGKADGGIHGTSYGAERSFITPVVPVASFNAQLTAGDAPLTVNFTDMSTGGITSWLWDFGDGSSTQQNPSHTYTTIRRTYSVSLTVTGPGGTDTETKENYISVYAPSTGKAPKPARFVGNYLNISPTQVYPNQPVSISLNVANTGGLSGGFTVYLNINGNIEQSRTIPLYPGSSQRVTFNVTKSTPGTYVVSVAGMHGQFYVNDIMVANPSASAVSTSATSGELGTGDIIAMVLIGIMVIAGITVVITLARQV